MAISTEYAVLSKDKKTILLPDDIQWRLEGADRFVVLVEGDSIILKKAYAQRTLQELVIREQAPLTECEMDTLIHETRT